MSTRNQQRHITMPPRRTTWFLEPHTRGKHLVLESYLQAWLPIMTRWNRRVLFIDAFAGPGEYSTGEPGSPVIALRALIDHRAKNRIQSEVIYQFIENDVARSDHLEAVLAGLTDELPPGCNYEVINSTFDETLTEVLDRIDEQRSRLAPAFVMIDPFGVSGTPMKTIKRILENPKSEVYISFMFREINRFAEHPSFETHLDDLFGCSQWRLGRGLTDSNARKEFYCQLYKSQLKQNGAQHVLRFELFDGERLVYVIFFGTNSLEGCDKMKQAIWKVVPFGDFRFRGSHMHQLTLGGGIVDFGLLETTLIERFGSKGWQKIEDVEEFVNSDATDFHSGHLKIKTLKPMEAKGKVKVERAPGKRAGTFAPGTRVLFL